MKKFILLKKLGFSFVILLVLFFANSANAVTINGTLSNGATGEIEVANNSKIDKDTATVNISIDFDPGTTPFNLPSGIDEIIVRVKNASGTSFGATNVYVANQKPTSDPIMQSMVPAQDYYNTYPNSNSAGNKVRLTIEGSTDKKIYYQSDEFKVFQYNSQPNNNSSKTLPLVTTNAVSKITQTSATFNGNLTNTGGDTVTITGFEYGTTTSYGGKINKSGSFPVGSYTQSTTNLTCGTTYHLRAYATNSVGTANGGDATFTTGSCGNNQNNNIKYYFTWQDIAGGFKTEREIIGKDACEAERTSGQYKITTPCSTTSQKTQNDAFNKTSGLFQFTWKMDNFITKASLSGGGATSAECELNKAGKTSSITPAELKNWTLTKSCLNLTGVDAYYFTWQENNDSIKSEVAFTNKSDCEKERVNTKYKNATACYTPSKQDEINIYNKALIVDPQTQPKKFYSDYTLLAPIGGLEKIGNDSNTKIGDYMNILLLIAIGLCGALAVIMIVIRGVQYMGDDSVFGKTEAKQQIMQAIIGLLLALGAYAILNTISPKLVGGSLTFRSVNVTISADDTSTGSSTSVCLSTPPPNPDSATGIKTTLNDAEKKYVEEINKITSIPKGIKLLMTAQTHIEGFFVGSKSYKTNNPGNISNTDKAPANWTCASPGINCFDTLAEGIKAQSEMYTRIGTNTSTSYRINGKYDTCILGGESYNGSLYQYLWIYSTGARKNNSYVNQIIGYFDQEGVKITARTKMSEIYNIK